MDDFALEPVPARTRRIYSEEQIASALAIYDSCGSLTETERLTGIPDSTLSQWLYGERRNLGKIPQLRNEQGQNLIRDFQQIAQEACRVGLSRLKNPRKANKIPFIQLMNGAGIAVDRYQLLSGQPTSISGSVMSDDERRLRLAELISKVSERQEPPKSDPE
jgi:hypothetical protein